MTMMIDILPQDIFQQIQTFLSNDDYHYFLNSSKILFGELKRKTILFKLNKERSFLYATEPKFRLLLLSKVENGWNQICIRYSDTVRATSKTLLSNLIPKDLPIYKVYGENAKLPFHYWNNYKSIKCDFFSGGAVEIPPFPNLEDLHLYVNPYEDVSKVDTSIIDLRAFSHLSSLTINHLKVKDITALKDISCLSLSVCEEITDFTVLSHQKELRLSGCPGLTDVTNFRSIRKFELTNCPNVFDISPLKGIYDLTLYACSKIKDISCLGNHHRLSLSDISSGFESLLHIPHVTLIECDIEDVNVLRFAKSVVLNWCTKVNSVGPLKTVKNVRIINSGRSGFSQLGEVSDLFLSLQDEIKINDESIAFLNNRRLSLDGNCLTITSLSAFSSSIQHLHVGRSEVFAKFINAGQGVLLQHLLSLTLDSLLVMKLEGIGHIPTVRIMSCNFLQTVKGLGANRFVEVNNCSCLQDVSSLASVSIVTIKYCSGLTMKNCESLKNVPRLKIIVL